ncbi:UNVERIFIED_CONTAM: hypothetical protein GTU68_054990, partial [Idotea baltica]|nr:hypothetical protein [Idotea baltica]
MDIVVSLLLILTLSPLLAFLALLVRLTSKGSILFRQKRISHKGREFVCYKFRSMKENERRPEITPESQDDHTSIGTFLREWYLDELPQLFNVLKGDISLIGPR